MYAIVVDSGELVGELHADKGSIAATPSTAPKRTRRTELFLFAVVIMMHPRIVLILSCSTTYHNFVVQQIRSRGGLGHVSDELDARIRDQRLLALGAAIRARRQTLRLTQQQLADAIDSHQNDVHRIESGQHALGWDRLWQIADALETTPSELAATAEDIYEG